MSEFDAKWKRWAEVSYSKAVMKHIRKEFMEMFGYEEFPKVEKVYDAGCGLARYSEFFPKETHYFGVDFSDSIDVARKHYDPASFVILSKPTLTLIKGDMRAWWGTWEGFDLVIAVGTLHHTPNTEEAFELVSKYVKPGGTFCLSVYAKKHPIREAVDDAIRSVTTKMSEEELLEFSQMITDVGWTLRKEDEELQEWFYYNVLKCYYNLGLDNDFSASVNYDWLKPEFAWRHEADEILAWAAASNFSVGSLKSTKSAHWARLVKDE